MGKSAKNKSDEERGACKNGAHELYKTLKEESLRYLVVGGTAAVLYGVRRATFDLDIALSKKTEEIERFLIILKKLGYKEITDTKTEKRIGKMGEIGAQEIIARGSVRAENSQAVDIVIVSPPDFDSMWEYRIEAKYKGASIVLPNILDLIRLKGRAGRPIDLEDAKKLRQILKTRENQKRQ